MDEERSYADWVQRKSPYQGNRLFMHLLIAQRMDDSGEDHFAATREYLAKMMHCNIQTIANIEHDMVSGGYLELRRSERYGRGCREYHLLDPEDVNQRPKVRVRS